MLKRFYHFRKSWFFHERLSQKRLKINLIFALIFDEISLLFRHRFSYRFFHRFLMKKAPKTEAKSIRFSDQKSILFVSLSFMCRPSPRPPILEPLLSATIHFESHLAHFGLPLGGLWRTLGSYCLPFGSFLVPLGSLLGVPWLTFGALSFTFAHPGIHFLTFAVSWPHFSYLFELSMKISCKIWFLHNFFGLFQAALASTLGGLTEACQPKEAEGEGKF